LNEFIKNGRKSKLGESAGPLLVRKHEGDEGLATYVEQYRIPKFTHASFEKGQHVRGVIGMDGGSTSSKAVMIDYETGEILTKQYMLSKGNPIADTKEILAKIKAFALEQGATFDIMGFGATGYAADVL